MEETLELARAAVAAGTRTMVATSHVSPRYPNDPHTLALAVREVNARLAAEGIPLEVRGGGEIAPGQIEHLGPDDLFGLRLGGGPWLLLESPFTQVVAGIPGLLGLIQADGHRIVLAHPERCPGFRRKPEMLRSMVHEQGVLMSVTAGALAGRFGREVKRFALGMAQEGLIHNVASDAHDCDIRPPEISGPLAEAGLAAHAELLVEAMPRAILDGTDLPEHPGPLREPRRRKWRARPPG
jgi:protein-tyrosine phosphatase